MWNAHTLSKSVEEFNRREQVGPDPLAALYRDRRSEWSLFAPLLSDAEMEALRPYVFAYETLPETPNDPPVPIRNLVSGGWTTTKKTAVMPALFDRRVRLAEIPDSNAPEVEQAVSAAWAYWTSLTWADEVLQYRKWVVKNLSKLLHYFREECLREIRQQVPKTRLEAEKDFWEGKRAADHLEGAADKAMQGRLVPTMIEGHTYWKNEYIPAGPAVILTPMNFIYGIPLIQMVGAYLSGSPFIFKGHPFAAITNTTLARIWLAAGADPRVVHKLEGFGGGVHTLPADPRIKVASVTGSERTARSIQRDRGLGKLWFEGGGCNWCWVDEGYSDDEMQRIAERLTYSLLAFSTHKCTGLHGVAGTAKTLGRLVPRMNREIERWTIEDPRKTEAAFVIGPLMVHTAQTTENIVAAAEQAGVPVIRRGGRVADGEYAKHAEVVTPAILGPVRPGTRVRCDWDGKGAREIDLTTEEFFQPILVTMEATFDEFVRFSLFHNPHDLATSIYTRDDRKLTRARQTLGGMLKENDGTDSAFEWEAFGASGVGDSGNTGVGDAESTIRMFCRAQKGRHVVF